LIENKIETLLDKLFSNEGEDFQHCFLVSIKAGTNNKVEVFVDSEIVTQASNLVNVKRLAAILKVSLMKKVG